MTVLPHLGNGVFGIASRMGIAVARTRLSPRMLLVIEVLADDWRRLDQRIDGLSRRDRSTAGHFKRHGGARSALGCVFPFSKGSEFGALFTKVINGLVVASTKCRALVFSMIFRTRGRPIWKRSVLRFLTASPRPIVARWHFIRNDFRAHE